MNQRLIGICASSMWVTALVRLDIPRIDVASDIYVPVTYSLLAIVASVAVFTEKRWGYWAALVLAGTQLFAICYVATIAFEGLIPLSMDVLFKNSAVLITIVSASMLLRKK
ncbi:hypothetical protein JO972_16530 [Verrucomicrobiaceae bacterium 5K15]|uniref:Uncharacterized protein n=1 Tax=Oceaniferula flava TaxID=2800421 RepID=A0AAE2SDW6_9BACT|nr:hypothetical protein [Oceaniferula flavus]MBK1856578.1 hypothetical protein [Oceaniferula flavus]MBM1137885.1 hypothetical protein [Oceaniferula flavus]